MWSGEIMKRTSNAPPSAPPRAASPRPHRPREASSPSTSALAPPFGRLLLAALRSVGIEYVSLDHLRKAKKDALNAEEHVLLWKLLHDLVLVVQLDFQVDADAMRAAQSEVCTESQLALWQELVRHYLYEWGFVCRAFYREQEPAPASVLLLAIAWLLAFSKFMERQHPQILAIYVETTTTATTPPRLPPYPNDVVVPATDVVSAVARVETCSQQLRDRIQGELDATARLNQLQALVGRIHAQHRTLLTTVEQYKSMLTRLEERQRANGAERDDELIPAYAVQVIAAGKSQLELHVRMLTERLQMIEDEKLFYKWINGTVQQYTPDESSNVEESTAVLESQYVTLYADILHAKTALEHSAGLYKQIVSLYADETKKWQQKAKTRTQQAKMDEKMDKLRCDIAANELIDMQSLFLSDKTESSAQATPSAKTTHVRFVEEAELERLQGQLERVMLEITTQYCRVELI